MKGCEGVCEGVGSGRGLRHSTPEGLIRGYSVVIPEGPDGGV
jgi:hypothetical protein